jgi:hypothetical protein
MTSTCKEKNMSKELRAIKKWLKKDGNTEALLASRLGYTSSVSIKMWFKRNNVPEYQRTKLMEEIVR